MSSDIIAIETRSSKMAPILGRKAGTEVGGGCGKMSCLVGSCFAVTQRWSEPLSSVFEALVQSLQEKSASFRYRHFFPWCRQKGERWSGDRLFASAFYPRAW